MAWQKITINLPKRYGPLERQAIAQDVIDFIIERTKSGLDKNNKTFPGYSKAYKNSLNFKIAGKSSKVDLTLTDEMLSSLGLISQSSGQIMVGYDKSDKELNGKVEGNRLGTYGQSKPLPGKKRDFLGITAADLKQILEKYPADTSRDDAAENLAAAKKAGELANGIKFNG